MAPSSKEYRLKWEPFFPGAEEDKLQERFFGGRREFEAKIVTLLHLFVVALTGANVISIYLPRVWRTSSSHRSPS